MADDFQIGDRVEWHDENMTGEGEASAAGRVMRVSVNGAAMWVAWDCGIHHGGDAWYPELVLPCEYDSLVRLPREGA